MLLLNRFFVPQNETQNDNIPPTFETIQRNQIYSLKNSSFCHSDPDGSRGKNLFRLSLNRFFVPKSGTQNDSPFYSLSIQRKQTHFSKTPLRLRSEATKNLQRFTANTFVRQIASSGKKRRSRNDGFFRQIACLPTRQAASGKKRRNRNDGFFRITVRETSPCLSRNVAERIPLTTDTNRHSEERSDEESLTLCRKSHCSIDCFVSLAMTG